MKKVILLFALTCSSVSFAQNNTLPTTGNVGVGTLNPDSKLEVNGNLKVDSCLIVKDSIIVEKDIHTKERMIVDGATIMNDDAVVGQNFNVLGNAEFDGTTKMFGTTVVEGNFKMPVIQDAGNNGLSNGSFDFMMLNSNGAVRSGDFESLIDVLKSGVYAEEPDTYAECANNAIVQNPSWTNGPNKIFSVCPQVFVGIGTDDPLHSLDVRGRGFFAQTIGIGIQPNPAAQVLAKTNLEVGFCISHNYNQDYGYAFKAIINNPLTKGIGIYNNLIGNDVFTVLGTGKTFIGAPSETEGIVNIRSEEKYGVAIDQASTIPFNAALFLSVQGNNDSYAMQVSDKVTGQDVLDFIITERYGVLN